ncbi:carbohydrate ABC transporter permease [Euzebya tangerina]|uniref:carbohydrate ABC transporter permease n=1 Tax=Euzebya tangerina TaxID=591198 RepID=UPI000E31EB09|nr:sugar ABC transporter permease [Euzebya tangerina]
MDKIISTLITVVIAVGASAGLWVGANLVFNQARNNWSRFNAMAGFGIGFVAGVLLSGNRVLIYSDGSTTGLGQFGQWVWFPIVAGIACAAVAVLLSVTEAPGRRLLVGGGGGAAVGIIAGALTRVDFYPSLEVVPLLGYTAVLAGVGAGISTLRKSSPVGGALIGAAIGWVLGAWGAPEIGTGNAAWTVVAMAVPTALLGARFGLGRNPSLSERAILDQKSRGVIFLGPALLFIFATLVVPAVRTLYLSFLDRRSEMFVGLQNYTDTFTDRTSLDLSGWANLFTSRMFIVGVILLVLGAVIGSRSRQTTGHFVELGSPSMFPLLGGTLLFFFALFTVLRGTIINNLWWVVAVVFFSTALGLAVAVLAENAKFEKVAKSLIFMPMAISLVGASIIWRFMYQARDVSIEQTGVLNAAWVGLGRLSTGGGLPTLIVGGLAVLAVIGLFVMMARALTRKQYGRAAVPGVVALLGLWFAVRFWSPGGVGGVAPTDDGGFVAQTILFIQETPFNNFWLMVVLIWIQTGFAMVILSAAIRAVPADLLEAASVDGATSTQIFWRITLPQIATTIGVVVTTLIVLVMKVFDIVKVMTNGQFGTQVLANDMFATAFNNFDTGRGAALAMLILFSVLPVMIYNIRQMQEA